MHKCRRCVHSALLPYINANHLLDTTNGGLSETAKSILVPVISNTLDTLMVNKVAQSQINGRTVEISESENILQEDAISVSLSIGLVNYNKVINEEDDYIV